MTQEPSLARRATEALWLAAALAESASGQEPEVEARHRLRALAASRWGGSAPDGVTAQVRRALRRELGQVASTTGGQGRAEPEDLLETGLASGAELVQVLEELGGQDPGLRELVDTDFRMLDVGTGVAGVASSVAARWPRAAVLGIDVDPAVLDLARHVVRSREVAERVRLEHADVVDLPAGPTHDLVWLSLPMVAQDEALPALRAVSRSLRAGGRVVLASVSDGSDGDDVLQLAREWRLSVDGRCRWASRQALTAASDLGLEPRGRIDQQDAHVTLVSLAARS
ncbi:class I SAM-dependent methyltransferase [Serinicoccus kebangsaanensis]|uniref:class I SAM-dependent methyltransferase n=1 Tax=Serinicoccus kebangsaanensis TaxID=2602069 RepID=UPI00124CFDA9|nr:class I SAM-dependent methyltransferase [Serinicoccus kebangsaanensis]